MEWGQSWDGYGGCCQLTEDRRQRGELHLPCTAGRHTMLLSDLFYTTGAAPHVTYRRIVYRRSCKQRVKIIHTSDAVLNMLETISGLMHTHQHMCACTEPCCNAECCHTPQLLCNGSADSFESAPGQLWVQEDVISGVGKGSSCLLESWEVLGGKLLLLWRLCVISSVQSQPLLYRIDGRCKNGGVPAESKHLCCASACTPRLLNDAEPQELSVMLL